LQTQGLHRLHHAGAVSGGQGFNQAQRMAALHRAQHLAHRRLLQLPSAKGDGLVGQAQGIAHRAARAACQQAQRTGLKRHLLGLQHLLEVLLHGWRGHGAQVELQAAAEHRHRHLLRVGGGEHELEVGRRLFQRFEHGVEGVPGEHVHFVDHEHLEAPLHRLIDRLLQQRLHLIDTAIGGGVELGVIDEAPGVDLAAGRALATGFGRDTPGAIGPGAAERFGQDARHRGLSHPARAGKQVGVVQALAAQGVAQRLHHVLLAHHLGKVLRPVLAGQNEVRHAPILFSGLQSDPTGLPAW